MKFVELHPFADPDAAARKLVEIASTIEPMQDGRIFVELVNAPFLKASGALGGNGQKFPNAPPAPLNIRGDDAGSTRRLVGIKEPFPRGLGKTPGVIHEQLVAVRPCELLCSLKSLPADTLRLLLVP
jgi:hypothetical protein